jgi:hypothetical protein
VAFVRGVALADSVELLQSKLADGLQHREAHTVIWLLSHRHEVLVDESFERRNDIDLGHVSRDGFGGVQRPAAGEDAEATEERLLAGGHEFVTPDHRFAQGLLPLRKIERAASQHGKDLAGSRQARQHRGGRQESCSRGGQFDCRRQTV